MEEQDYLNATNLAKLRIAEYCLQMFLPTEQERVAYQDVVRKLAWLRENYENRVSS